MLSQIITRTKRIQSTTHKKRIMKACYLQIEKIRILADAFRNTLGKYNQVLDIVSG
jgi:hypothetical protein